MATTHKHTPEPRGDVRAEHIRLSDTEEEELATLEQQYADKKFLAALVDEQRNMLEDILERRMQLLDRKEQIAFELRMRWHRENAPRLVREEAEAKIRTLPWGKKTPSPHPEAPRTLDQLAQGLLEEWEKDFRGKDKEDAKLGEFFRQLAPGATVNDAAEDAGFTSGDLRFCPPAKKARIVLESFLGRHGNDFLAQEYERLAPEFVPSEIVVDAEALAAAGQTWLQEEMAKPPKERNFAGRCWRMSASPKLEELRIALDTDNGIVYGVLQGKDAEKQRVAFEKVRRQLEDGTLLISKGGVSQAAGLKVERTTEDGKFLVCLHCMTDSRIAGYYYADTGEIIWQEFIPDHRRWGGKIKNS